MKTVIFGAGGTAGHVFMARGIAYYVKAHRILVTDLRGSKYICDCTDCMHKGGKAKCLLFDQVVVLPIRNARPKEFLGILKSLWICIKLGWKYRGSIFVGCGAYASVIPAIGCLLSFGRIFLYQGDQIPGLANRVLQWIAEICWVSDKSISLRNKKEVGCIVRHNISYSVMENTSRFRILVLGSSVGSSLAHKVLPDSLEMIDKQYLDKIEVVHQIQTGYKEYAEEVYSKLGISYSIQDYVDSIEELPKATLVIGRAGWSLLSDLIASKRAAIIVPWKGAKGNHQYYNGLWFCRNDLQWLLQEEQLTKERLAWFLTELIKDTIEQNADSNYITRGIIAERSKYPGYSSEGGRRIAEAINKKVLIDS
jgi:UDP-N-acetylglucosamine--N-acetylmuramyl-(pentapeptide) pyrophosphoryl-undecaprenol N-acetylglucosamine transferase